MKVIGIAGGSGSGKTTFARLLTDGLGRDRVRILAQDNYYIDQSENFDKDGGQVNFDQPDAIDWPLLTQHIQQLLLGQSVQVPVYDFATHKRKKEFILMDPADYLIIDGILILGAEKLLSLINLKIYIDTSESVRFSRRLRRDVSERGRTEAGVRAQFISQVKPMHDKYVEPTKNKADKIVSGEQDFSKPINEIINLLAQ